MFGKNEIVGRSFFAGIGEETLAVTSVFYTLQGEGPLSGRPAVFVRLAKCNLACEFCDTYFDTGDAVRYSELMEAIISAVQGPGPQRLEEYPFLRDLVLVVTGGEPSLQTNLVAFLQKAVDLFSVVQIESNGLQLLDGMPDSVYLVVSPKCSTIDFWGRRKAIHYLRPPDRVLWRANCLKFLLSSDPTSPYHTVPEWAHVWATRGKLIYVSPMAEYTGIPEHAPGNLVQRSKAERVSFWEPGLLDLAKVRANHEYAAQYCLDHRFFLSLQMQLFASLP